MKIQELTTRSYDPLVGSCIVSYKKLKSNQRARSLIAAIDTKEYIKTTERELKSIDKLIRNLPMKKKKLSGQLINLHNKYNNLIDSENLPLKKL